MQIRICSNQYRSEAALNGICNLESARKFYDFNKEENYSLLLSILLIQNEDLG